MICSFTFQFVKHTWSNPSFGKYSSWIFADHSIQSSRSSSSGASSPLEVKTTSEIFKFKESKHHQEKPQVWMFFFIFIHLSKFKKILHSWVRARFGLKWTFIHQTLCPCWLSRLQFAAIFLFLLQSFLLLFRCPLFSFFFTFCSPLFSICSPSFTFVFSLLWPSFVLFSPLFHFSFHSFLLLFFFFWFW